MFDDFTKKNLIGLLKPKTKMKISETFTFINTIQIFVDPMFTHKDLQLV